MSYKIRTVITAITDQCILVLTLNKTVHIFFFNYIIIWWPKSEIHQHLATIFYQPCLIASNDIHFLSLLQ